MKKEDILKLNKEAIDRATERIMKAVKKEPSDEFFDAVEETVIFEERENRYTRPTRGVYHFPIAGWYSINFGEPKYYTPEDTVEMDEGSTVTFAPLYEYWKNN